MTPPKHRECPDPAKWITYLDSHTRVAANGCHYFTGHIGPQGYGRYKWRTDGCDNSIGVHRAAWLAKRGPLADGLVIDHACHTNDPTCLGGRTCLHRRCINVDHLEPVTSYENWRRGIYQPPTPTPFGTRFAISSTYPCGSPRTEWNTHTSRTSRGGIQRTCLHCYREHNRRAVERRRTA